MRAINIIQSSNQSIPINNSTWHMTLAHMIFEPICKTSWEAIPCRMRQSYSPCHPWIQLSPATSLQLIFFFTSMHKRHQRLQETSLPWTSWMEKLLNHSIDQSKHILNTWALQLINSLNWELDWGFKSRSWSRDWSKPRGDQRREVAARGEGSSAST